MLESIFQTSSHLEYDIIFDKGNYEHDKKNNAYL